MPRVAAGKGGLFLLATAIVSAPAALAAAQSSAPTSSSAPYAPYLALALFALVPLLLMTATSFVKVSVVLSILRNAFGIGDVPSGAIVTAFAVILSLYVMAPVAAEVATAATPAAATVNAQDPLADLPALERVLRAASEPLKRFLYRNSNRRERRVFLDLARRRHPADQRDQLRERDLLVLLPAFLITELGEAFQLGFIIFLPFLVVDLVVTNILMSVGMTSLSPNRVALPFKLLLFVLTSGWLLITRALVLSYH